MTLSVAKATNTSIFEVLEADAEEVIDIINYLIERGNDTDKKEAKASTSKRVSSSQSGEIRRHVTNATATGGWY